MQKKTITRLLILVIVLAGLTACTKGSDSSLRDDSDSNTSHREEDGDDANESADWTSSDGEAESPQYFDELVLVLMNDNDPESSIVREVYDYNEVGQMISSDQRKRPAGSSSTSDMHIDYTYDEKGLLYGAYQDDGYTWYYTYGDAGNLMLVERYRNKDFNLLTKEEYDSEGREIFNGTFVISSGKSVPNHTLSSEYDGNGKLVKSTEYYKEYPGYTISSTIVTTYYCDTDGQLIKTIEEPHTGHSGYKVIEYTYTPGVDGYTSHQVYYSNPDDPATVGKDYVDRIISYDNYGNEITQSESHKFNALSGAEEVTNNYSYFVYDGDGNNLIYYSNIAGNPPEGLELSYDDEGRILSSQIMTSSAKYDRCLEKYVYEYMDDGRILCVTHSYGDNPEAVFTREYTYMTLDDYFELKEELAETETTLIEYYDTLDSVNPST